MNISISRIFSSLAFAGLLGAVASNASVQATFHLPVATHWGRAVLAPGDYKVRVMDQTSGRNQLVIEGAGHIVYQMPLAIDAKELANPSSLQLVEVGGNYFVKEYRSASAGKVFTFGVPKQMASRSVRTIEITN